MNVKDITCFNITRSALNIIEKHIRNGEQAPESGGILLGQVKNNEVYILKVTTPNKFDVSNRYSFECNKDAAQIIINYEFINSEKKTIYLGEWHTHPENYPTPSQVDKKMIKNQYKKNELKEPFLMLLIIGLKGLYSAVYNGRKLQRIKLNIIAD